MEPVNSWKNVAGNNLLKRMYCEQDAKKGSVWLTRFQMRVIQDLMKQDEEIRSLLGVALCVQERDVDSVIKVFLPFNEEIFHPVDYKLLMDWAKLGRDLNVGKNKKRSIYLECEPKIAYERMTKRARPEEKQMTFEAFEKLHAKMQLLKESADFVLDTSCLTEDQVFKTVHKLITSNGLKN